MKLLNLMGEIWRFELDLVEVVLLKDILKQFPITESSPAIISKTGRDPKSVEREKLLNKSLAEHRKELKKQAMRLIGPDKIQFNPETCLLTVTGEEREILLQILNDIRVGCWNALGRLEKTELNFANLSEKGRRDYICMDLAGYFEHNLLTFEPGSING